MYLVCRWRFVDQRLNYDLHWYFHTCVERAVAGDEGGRAVPEQQVRPSSTAKFFFAEGNLLVSSPLLVSVGK